MTLRTPVACVALLCASTLSAQPTTTTPPPLVVTPAPTPTPMIDLRFIRYKVSAGDLPSAESILETHRAEKGEDEEYLLGLAWVARGAALTADWPAASRYAGEARAAARARLGRPPVWENHSEAAYALGTAIEVDAQALVAAGKKKEALDALDAASRTLEAEKAPYNIRARVWKRRNQIALVGAPAPEIVPDDGDHVGGAAPPTLASLRGKPVVLFLWWESCGDCKAQAAALRRTVAKYADRGVVFVAPTRYYGTADERAEERGKIEKAWREVYDLPASVPVPISDAAMLRYGVSATPTFVFVDRKGVVTDYLPYRMTEERLAQEIDRLLR